MLEVFNTLIGHTIFGFNLVSGKGWFSMILCAIANTFIKCFGVGLTVLLIRWAISIQYQILPA